MKFYSKTAFSAKFRQSCNRRLLWFMAAGDALKKNAILCMSFADLADEADYLSGL